MIPVQASGIPCLAACFPRLLMDANAGEFMTEYIPKSNLPNLPPIPTLTTQRGVMP